MTRPVLLVSSFDGSLDAVDASGATAWAVDTGDEEYTSTSPAQLALVSTDSDQISITSTGHLDPQAGFVAFWFIRDTDTGSLEFLLECGADPEDWLRVYIDDDLLTLSWASNGGLPQTVQHPTPIPTGEMIFVYCEWSGLTQAISVNGGPKTVGVRDLVTGVWGAGDLVLKAA